MKYYIFFLYPNYVMNVLFFSLFYYLEGWFMSNQYNYYIFVQSGPKMEITVCILAMVYLKYFVSSHLEKNYQSMMVWKLFWKILSSSSITPTIYSMHSLRSMSSISPAMGSTRKLSSTANPQMSGYMLLTSPRQTQYILVVTDDWKHPIFTLLWGIIVPMRPN